MVKRQGIEANMDISIGGLSDLMAQAQGTADADASTVSGHCHVATGGSAVDGYRRP